LSLYPTGWGRLGTGLDISTTLQKVNLQLYSRFDCAQIHNPEWILYNNICAGVPGGYQGQCSGEFQTHFKLSAI
jgi:Trypsin